MSKVSQSLAKLALPRLGHVFPRHKLFDLLDGIRESASMVWLSAPGGSGKTSLVASYLQENDLHGIWYQADIGDGDLSSYFYYLGIALNQLLGDEERQLPAFKPEHQQNIAVFARHFFRELFAHLPNPGYLVLDNYQDIPADSPLHEIMSIACSEAPAGLTILVISRTDPPSEFTRLRSTNALAVLGWDTLQLNHDEAEAICRMRLQEQGRDLDERSLEAVVRTTRGWVAGLVLLMEQSQELDFDKAFDDRYNQPVVFDYFAGEILQHSDEQLQQFLLSTACLPSIELGVAEQLSGHEKAGQVLEDLTRRNFFTTRTRSGIYEYHPLFREFLQNKAAEVYSEQALRENHQRAAQLLSESGNWRAAADLFCKAQDWSGLIRLAVEHGRDVMETGRYRLLRDWLLAVPEDIRRQSSWAMFWLGESQRVEDLLAGRESYRTAFEGFVQQQDVAGQLLAWCGVIETYIHAWSDFTPLDEWISKGEEMLGQHELPSPEIGARVAIAMFCALMHRQPSHPMIGEWEGRVRVVVQKNPDITQRMALGFQLLLYYTVWTGNIGKAGILMESLRDSIDEKCMAPLDLSLWRAIESTYLWKTGDSKAALAAARDGLNQSDSIGVHLWDVWLLANAVYASAMQKDYKAADKYLASMSRVLDRRRLTDVIHYHYLACWLAHARDDYSVAYENIQEALTAARETGSPYSTAMMLLSLARLHIEAEKFEQADTCTDEAEQIAGSMHSSSIAYLCALTRAECRNAQNHEDELPAILAHVFKLAREVGYVHHGDWWEKGMVRLCIYALEHAIESEFVRDFVRRRRLQPDEPPLLLMNWPWPVKIYTLGRFSVLLDDEPLALSGKSRHKPLQLLKIIVAMGGRQVGQDKVIELLWPDSDGDAALQALYTTTHRLRKLLGDKIISFQDGNLTLDQRSVWVDAWAFERTLGQANDLLAHGRADSGLRILTYANQLKELYPGHFLGSESGLAWALPLQERLKAKYLKTLADMGWYWEQQGKYEYALACYEDALELDLLAEAFYQRLMKAYDKMGRQAEAASVFMRCRKNLSDGLGVSPSSATVSLYTSIQSGNPLN